MAPGAGSVPGQPKRTRGYWRHGESKDGAGQPEFGAAGGAAELAQEVIRHPPLGHKHIVEQQVPGMPPEPRSSAPQCRGPWYRVELPLDRQTGAGMLQVQAHHGRILGRLPNGRPREPAGRQRPVELGSVQDGRAWLSFSVRIRILTEIRCSVGSDPGSCRRCDRRRLARQRVSPSWRDWCVRPCYVGGFRRETRASDRLGAGNVRVKGAALSRGGTRWRSR